MLMQKNVAVSVVKLKWIKSFCLELLQYLLLDSPSDLVAANLKRLPKIGIAIAPLLQLFLSYFFAGRINHKDGSFDF